ncbi:unnamed protein product [Closterium sp. NIES-64]|nr:unnamed protein product [Closterium sp. NIES-64]
MRPGRASLIVLSLMAIVALLALIVGLLLCAKGTPGETPPGTTTSNSNTLILLRNNRLGAKCLDGSPPGYYFRPGTGSGRRKWQVYLPGGGWCAWFGGILSAHETENPVFNNWNLVRLVYCDGGGYAGTRGRIKLTRGFFRLNSTATASSRTVRLAAATNAVLEDLQHHRGFGAASQILLSGSSAGGQATANLCDWLASSFPSASIRCLVDSGFFLGTPSQ